MASKVVNKSKRKQKFCRYTPKLKKSLTPGTVVILLRGEHQGKRCIFLKQLGSGFILVTGPKIVNGVPLMRADQKMVIVTSHKIDLSEESLKIYERVKDKTLKASIKSKQAYELEPMSSEMIGLKRNKRILDVWELSIRDLVQDRLDKSIIAKMETEKDADTRRLNFGYLRSVFSLGTKDLPHKMAF
ncbi:MAG: 60S ribosomal protein L6 [Marteilia pararefringens]